MSSTEPTLKEKYDNAVFLPVNPPEVNQLVLGKANIRIKWGNNP